MAWNPVKLQRDFKITYTILSVTPRFVIVIFFIILVQYLLMWQLLPTSLDHLQYTAPRSTLIADHWMETCHSCSLGQALLVKTSQVAPDWLLTLMIAVTMEPIRVWLPMPLEWTVQVLQWKEHVCIIITIRSCSMGNSTVSQNVTSDISSHRGTWPVTQIISRSSVLW